MSQHDYVIANQYAAPLRADLNSALEAIVTNNSGASEPSATFPYMWWADTTSGILKQRNAADDGWVNFLSLGKTALAKANNLSDLASAATAFNNIKQAATTTTTGVVEKATAAEMTAGTADKFPDCSTVKTWVEANASVVPFSRVRQTVLTGPIDSNGRADFLVDGGGLSVDTSGLTSTPLIISYGDGFDATSGEVNIVVEIDADLTWSSLTDDAVNYLYVDYDDSGNVASATASTLPPDYRQAPETDISSPSSGQFWYPTKHRSRGKTYNGATWDSELRVCVGQATAASGSITEVISYAYQGKAVATVNADPDTAQLYISVNDNIGTNKHNKKVCGLLVEMFSSDSLGYSDGDAVDLNISSFFRAPSSNYPTSASALDTSDRNITWYRLTNDNSNGRLRIPDAASIQPNTTLAGARDFTFIVERAF